MKGATGSEIGGRAEHCVSIHAPVKGATCSTRTQSSRQPSFNPRSREGSDPGLHRPTQRTDRFSIHAPVKGATPRAGGGGTARGHARSFNPRSREGSDPTPTPDPSQGQCFNPRSREWERRGDWHGHHYSPMGFNPRSREGSDNRTPRRSCYCSTGAWIETLVPREPIHFVNVSLPSRERGLKPPVLYSVAHASPSLPSRERGLKHTPHRAWPQRS